VLIYKRVNALINASTVTALIFMKIFWQEENFR